VSGWTITIPDNLIVQFPATWMPFKDFAAGGYTGLEVNVNGNIVSDAVFHHSQHGLTVT
jgi:hypothetical protein